MRFFISLLCLLCSTVWLAGQPSLRAVKKTAELLIKEEKYAQALPLFTYLETGDPGDVQVKKMLGICQFHQNQIPAAIRNLQAAVIHKKTNDEDTNWYLASAYHADHQFEKAVDFYKIFLKKAEEKDPRRPAAKEKILNCAFGQRNTILKKEIVVENLGGTVNSAGDEFAPVISPNHENKIYFSAGVNSPKDEKPQGVQIFFTTQNGEKWTPAQPLSKNVDSTGREILLEFDEQGQKMYFFKSAAASAGEILVNDFQLPQKPTPFKSPLRVDRGDMTICLPNDSTLIFASNRAGGFGGYDLYSSVLKDGYWTLPTNLGPLINSGFDETSPFLCKDGVTLYFSSNRSEQSFGGYDILKSMFDYETGKWSAPENPGLPLNSAGDDLYFRLSADGARAFFSSARKNGKGKSDIYTVFFKNALTEMRPETEVVTFAENRYSGRKPSKTIPGKDFYKEWHFENIRFEPNSSEVAASSLKTLDKVHTFLNHFPRTKVLLTACSAQKSDPYFLAKKAEKVALYLSEKGLEMSGILVRGWDGYFVAGTGKSVQAGDFVEVYFSNTAVALPPLAYAEKQIGQLKGLSYKVQIASGENYESDFLSKYPNATVEKTFLESSYHFTVGLYPTFYAADQLRKQLLKKGMLGSKIIPYIDGFRIDETEAKELVKTYPDLKNYLASRKR